jgi:predicted DNA-binding transcriptional regulator YafY
MNKLFRVSRIGSVEVTDTEWEFESEHRSAKMDVFRTGGSEGKRVQLELGVMAKNLLLEEYPLAVRDLSPIPGTERWLLDTVVYRYEGVGRFVIGLANDVVIREGDGLKDYLREFVAGHCKALF